MTTTVACPVCGADGTAAANQALAQATAKQPPIDVRVRSSPVGTPATQVAPIVGATLNPASAVPPRVAQPGPTRNQFAAAMIMGGRIIVACVGLLSVRMFVHHLTTTKPNLKEQEAALAAPITQPNHQLRFIRHTDSNYSSQEATDAETVAEVVKKLPSGGDLEGLQAILAQVVKHCPKQYVYRYQTQGGDFIKFWDINEFLHFVRWQTENQPAEKSVSWVLSAYPQALFYLGFINISLGRYEQAIEFLDRGRSLEPTNPRFALEKAHALAMLRRFDEALATYDQIGPIGPHVAPLHLSGACRGRGFLLRKMGELDRAERELKRSLEYEPDNPRTIAELRAIDYLRAGGRQDDDLLSSVRVTPGSSAACGICGQIVTRGRVVEVKGRPVAVCERCSRPAH